MSVIKKYNGTTWETVGLENPVLTGATTTSLTGILKGNTGNVTVATPSVDYDLPHSNRAQLDLIGGTNIAPTLDGKDWPISAPIHNAVAKTNLTMLDANEIPILDSISTPATFGLKKLSLGSLKAWANSLFLSLSGGTLTGRLIGNVSGNLIVQPTTDSTIGFNIKSAGGTNSVLEVDTRANFGDVKLYYPGTPSYFLKLATHGANGGVSTISSTTYGGLYLDVTGATTKYVAIADVSSAIASAIFMGGKFGVGIGVVTPSEKISIVDGGNVSLGNLANGGTTTNSIILKDGVIGASVATGTLVTGSSIGLQTKSAAGDVNILGSHTAPINSAAAGTAGEIRFTSTGIFYCIASGNWVKATTAAF